MSEPSKEALEAARQCIGCKPENELLVRAFAESLDAFAAERVAEEREQIAHWWDDTEARSAEAHEVYQIEAHRRGNVRHPDAYVDLSEATKEWDRVLMRWVAAAIRRVGIPEER